MSFGFGLGFPKTAIARAIAAFTPSQLFAAGEQGAWYDPSDLTTLFQDAAGTVPVTGVEQPVRLMLDKSKGLVLGPELVTNGDFSNGTTGWTATNAALAVAGGELSVTNTGTNYGTASVALTTVVGRAYKISATVRTGTASPVYLQIKNASPTSPTNVASFSSSSVSSTGIGGVFFATSTISYICLVNNNQSNGTGYFDNISVRELPGNHATASANANRPVLSARVNLLTQTEKFGAGGIWAPYNASPSDNTLETLDPRGGNNAAKLSYGGAAASVYYDTSLVGSYKYSIRVKRGNFDVFNVAVALGPSVSATFNLISGVSSGANCTPSMQDIGGGWWQCEMLFTMPSGGRIVNYCGTAAGNYVYVFGADLRQANIGVNLPPYQRVGAEIDGTPTAAGNGDYDTVGFPLYLKANGTNTAMQTNSIDFSATDKMTVWAGARRLVNNLGMFLELSTAYNGGNPGSFGTYPELVSDAHKWTMGSTGSLTRARLLTVQSAPRTEIVAAQASITPSSISVRINGVNDTTPDTASQGTGNYGNYPLYLFARAGNSLFFNGYFYGLIVRGAQSSAAEIANAETWMNSKTMAYAA